MNARKVSHTLRTLHMRVPGYDRALNAYSELHRRAWYALDCPPTIFEGIVRRWFA